METNNSINSIIKPNEPIHIKDIIKVCILTNNNITRTIVFQGSTKSVDKDSDIFSDYERILASSIDNTIQPSSMQIHPDDSISTIKRKILHELNDSSLSYDELYLFSKKKITLFLHELYIEATNNDTEPLSQSKLGQLLTNLHIVDEDTLTYFNNLNKKSYTYNDLTDGLKLYTENIELSIPIGQRFSTSRELLFSANPFNVLQTNPLVFQTTNTNPLLAFENHLLLTYGNIINNTLYVSFAKDVLRYGEKMSIMGDYLINLYYPLLAKQNITSYNAIIENQSKLMDNTKKIMKNAYFKQYNNIDKFYHIYNNRNDELPYTKLGINEFNLTLHPVSKTIFPLDIVFKQLHATYNIPFIKYNPGYRREPIYRLYSTKRTKNGKKIPELSRVQISSYSKLSGKPKQLSMVINYNYGKAIEHIFLHMNHNGNIIVNGHCKNPLSNNNFNLLLIETINPILNQINDVLEHAGYNIVPFENMYDERIEYNDLKFICGIAQNKQVKPTELTILLSNMFHVYEADMNKGAILRFKHVENYKEMNAINALITQIYKNTNNINDVKQSIISNFHLSETDANLYVTNYLNDHIFINGNYVNKSIDIAENPGFPCLIKVSNAFASPEIVIELAEINSIQYIDTIQLYLDVFLRVTQFVDKSVISKTELLKMISKIKTDNLPVHDNVITINKTNNIQPFTLHNISNEDEDDGEGILFEDEDEDESQHITEPETETETEGLLFDNDDDEDEDDDELFVGGGSVFFDKMKNLEPSLFRTKKEGKFSSYARICQNQSSRQPVILTKEELDNIDKDSYEVAMPYGSDANNKYWYMCPRYWCLQNNKPMTEKQVTDGECGGKIIPQKSKVPPAGHYIYEFTDDKYHKDANDNYNQHRPGFLSTKTHPDHCLPCCFKNMNTHQQVSRRKECGVTNDMLEGNPDNINKLITNSEEPDETQTDGNKETSIPQKVRVGMNILGFDKFPIDSSRWGFLPLSVELFLHTDNSTSISKNNPALLRQNETPLLRHGVDYSHNQSFVACIADLYTYHNNIPTPSIDEMRDLILSKITLDIYIKSNNSSLVTIFQPKKTIIDNITIEKYKNTNFYKSFDDLTNISQNNFLKDTIASYHNFILFMKNKDSFIDHTYMWDIVSSPDTGLFENGINIALIEIINNDITDNISLLCPTNSYSSQLFDLSKGTCIILKQNDIYEPIYMYGNTNTSKLTKKNAVKIFYQHNTPANLLNVFSMINKTTNSYCKPKNSMPTVYEYKQNKMAKNIYNILIENNLNITNQVKNYRGKIIAFMVSTRAEDATAVYIPTYPSTPIPKIPSIFVDKVDWLDYDITRDKLTQIANTTNNMILCMPAFKVVEDGLIVGIFTETNQFIQNKNPTENIIEDDIPEYKTTGYGNGQYYEADKSFTTSVNKDTTRITTVRNISLESQFYNNFRSKTRILLNDYKYKKLRDAVVDTIHDKQLLYKTKMKKLEILIRHLLKPYITFVEFDDDVLNGLQDMNTIVNKDDLNKICLSKKRKICIPIKHLISNIDNEQLYFLRIADELIRYKRIQRFILDSNNYLNTDDIEYYINPDEIILLHSLITPENLDNLIPMVTNEYINNIPYEFANPNITNQLSSHINVPLSQQYNDSTNITLNILQQDCVKTSGPVLNTKTKWNTILHDNAVEHVSNITNQCSFYLLLFILKHHLNQTETIYDIKKRLCKYYEPLMNLYFLKICDILSKQGKRQFINMIKKQKITVEIMIMNDNYMLTSMDLWVFANATQLPVIMLDNTIVPNTNLLVLGGNPETDHFYFIKMINNNQFNLITPSSLIRDINGFQKLIESPNYENSIKSLNEHLDSYELAQPLLNIRKQRVKKTK
tara:strand:- start:7 stop:5559 length:5553 start_codon:yes stop_codon:yes gene_type:complete